MSDVVLVCLQVSDDLTGIYQGDYNTSTIHETVAMLTMTSLMCLLGINNNTSQLNIHKTVAMLMMTSLEY